MIIEQLGFKRVEISTIPVHFNLLELIIREWAVDSLPTIALTINYQDEFNKAWALQENDEISVELGGRTPDNREITVKSIFELKGWESTDSANGEITTLSMVGVLKLRNYFTPIQYRAFASSPVSSVLEELAGEISVEPDIRVKTADAQTWIQHTTTHRFIEHLIENSWVGEDDALFAYIDRNRRLVATSLQYEVNNQKTKKRFMYWPEGVGDNADSEDADASGKVYPFVGFAHKNISPITNLKSGYGIGIWKYDYTGLQFDIHRPNTTHLSSYGEMDRSLSKSGVRAVQSIQPDSAHDNFWKSRHTNDLFKRSLFSSPITIMSNSYPSVNVMDIISLEYNKLTTDSQSRDSQNPVYEGDYLIGGMTHYVAPPHTMRAYMTLFRGGFEKGLAMNTDDITSVEKGG